MPFGHGLLERSVDITPALSGICQTLQKSFCFDVFGRGFTKTSFIKWRAIYLFICQFIEDIGIVYENDLTFPLSTYREAICGQLFAFIVGTAAKEGD